MSDESCEKCDDPNNLGHYPCVRLTPRSELMALIDRYRISRDAERAQSAELRAEIAELKDKLRSTRNAEC
jgi:hypothetical protein